MLLDVSASPLSHLCAKKNVAGGPPCTPDIETSESATGAESRIDRRPEYCQELHLGLSSLPFEHSLILLRFSDIVGPRPSYPSLPIGASTLALAGFSSWTKQVHTSLIQSFSPSWMPVHPLYILASARSW